MGAGHFIVAPQKPILATDLGSDMARKDDDEDNTPAAADSRLKLERLARLMRQSGHAEGLNPVQWEALRYLKRCNQLSHSPGALARYLGSTKGTVSQTVIALEKKGFIEKKPDPKDSRGVLLFLTEAGTAQLDKDQLSALEKSIDDLSDKTRRRFDRALDRLLEEERLRQGEPSFGTCLTCRYFREEGSGVAAHCMKVNAAVSEAETRLICVEHVGR
jgi:DNA-binding MarR family transcriptional regulator